jgi:hypothetical protein
MKANEAPMLDAFNGRHTHLLDEKRNVFRDNFLIFRVLVAEALQKVMR